MPTRKTALIWVIIYQILAIILTLSWLAVTFIPNVMMFDAGYDKAIGIDLLMTLPPILMWWIGSILAWHWYRRDQWMYCAWAMTLPLILTALCMLALWWLL